MDSIKRFVPSGPVNANAGYNKGTTTTAANESTAGTGQLSLNEGEGLYKGRKSALAA